MISKDLACQKYVLQVKRGRINFLLYVFLSLVTILGIGPLDWDWRNNKVQILEKNNKKVRASIDAGGDTTFISAKKKEISEDLENLTIQDFEKKYEIKLFIEN